MTSIDPRAATLVGTEGDAIDPVGSPQDARKPVWARETQLSLLAYEIARYQPALATDLIEAGKRRLAE